MGMFTKSEVEAMRDRVQGKAAVIPATRRGRGVRRKPGTMNKTEAAYAQQLDLLKMTGQIQWYAFEGMTFKLAHDCRYTPDFIVATADWTIEAHEVKGFWEDDALVKIRVAATIFPFVFRTVTAKSKKNGGGFEVKEVKV